MKKDRKICVKFVVNGKRVRILLNPNLFSDKDIEKMTKGGKHEAG